MTVLNPSLHMPFTAAAADASRVQSSLRQNEEVLAEQLRLAAEQQKFEVGSTITARYQYKVASDGSLIPLESKITAQRPEDSLVQERGSRRSPRQYDPDRPPRFSDLAKPKPELSPAEELALYAAEGEEGVPKPEAAMSNPILEVVDEQGVPVEAEVIAPEVAKGGEKFAAAYDRFQQSVAGLYARNHDISYNITPMAVLAA